MPRFVVELEEDDLLPCPEGGTTVDDRQREAGSEEGGADMAMAVPIVPPALMAILDCRREEPFQRVRDILLHEPRFELVRHDGTRGRRGEDAREAIAGSGCFDYVRNAVRDVDRLNSTAGLERNRLPVSDHGDRISSAAQEGWLSPEELTLFKSTALRPHLDPGERKRSRGPLPALRRGSPEALAGGRWLGGGLLSVSQRRPMKPSSLKATGPRSQAASTVSGGWTSTWIAWLFCSSISFAAFSTSSARVVRYDFVRWSTTPWTIVTTM